MTFAITLSCPACGSPAFDPDPRSRYGIRPNNPNAGLRVNGESVLASCGDCRARWKLGELHPGREPALVAGAG